MNQGFLLSDKEKKRLELKQKLKQKILEKQSTRTSNLTKKLVTKKKQQKKQQGTEYEIHLTGDHSSQNIYNHVLYLMSDLEQHKNEKNRLLVAKSYEEKHSFLHKNYFNIYREVCYGRLNDLRLLQKLLHQRDLQMNKDKSEEEAAQNVGKILTEKFVKKDQMEKFEKMNKELEKKE